MLAKRVKKGDGDKSSKKHLGVNKFNSAERCQLAIINFNNC